MPKFAIVFLFFVFVFSQVSQQLLSQSSTAVVEGIVQDATGAVIQNCDVALLNTETGGKLSTQTNDAGVYVLPSVQPGVYTLEASK